MDDDHIPLKDEFSGDESDIDLGEKDEEMAQSKSDDHKNKKIKKKTRNCTWKLRWVKVPNAVIGSSPILIKKWVKIKLTVPESENEQNGKEHENICSMAAEIISRQNEIERNQGQ